MARPIQSRWYRLAIPVLGCASIASCKLFGSLANDDRPIPNEVEQVPVLREAVVPALLTQIDANGLFRYPAPNAAPGDMPFDTALVQAREFLFYAQNTLLRGVAEGARGAFIEMGKLLPCGYPHLLPSKYEPPPDSLGRVIQIWLGDHWAIPFCGAQRTPEVVVKIAARRNDTRYRDGRVYGPGADEAGAWAARGIPSGWLAEYMLTPEEAVNEAYAVTGARSARLPEIFRGVERVNGRNLPWDVPCPAWRVTLERPVRMAGFYSLRRLDLAEVYVADSDCPGPLGQTVILTPWHEQPTSREFADAVRDSTSPNGFRREVHVARYRAPADFESVIIER